MKIPTGFRRVDLGETILGSDLFQGIGPDQLMVNTSISAWVGGNVKQKSDSMSLPAYGTSWQILRKIDSPWISVKERKPQATDHNSRGMVLYHNKNGWVAEGQPRSSNADDATHWMPIPEVPAPIIPPITIQEGSRTHELFFNKDGSIKAGCVTIDKEKMKEIIERWKKEQE